MRFVKGTSEKLEPAIMAGMARHRHKVFVERLGWQLQCESGLEYDQFDRDDTLYVVAQGATGEVVGSARLLPTTRPYLLADVFPQLLNGVGAPASDDLWELSRFAAADFSSEATAPVSQFSSPIAVGLLRACLQFAAAQGARRLISVSPLGVERLLSRAGFRSHRAGPPMMVDGQPIFACFIELPA
jgi:acyl homoserine lactone synthase